MSVSLIFNWIIVIAFSGAIENEVIQADRNLNQLIAEHKVKEASEIYADDFILTTSSGKIKSKQDMLNEITLTDLLFEVNETGAVSVRSIENTAVLTGTLHQKGVYQGKPFDNRLQVTDTWVLVNGRWKLLAGHATLIK